MYNNLKKMNSSGFTLIEIIASIAILGMVIAVFLPIFPQMISWNKKTEQELVASNLLGQVAYDIKNDPSFNVSSSTLGESIKSGEKYHLNGVEYFPEIILTQSEEEKKLGLFRTYIKICDVNKKLISDTYIYLTSEGD